MYEYAADTERSMVTPHGVLLAIVMTEEPVNVELQSESYKLHCVIGQLVESVL